MIPGEYLLGEGEIVANAGRAGAVGRAAREGFQGAAQ